MSDTVCDVSDVLSAGRQTLGSHVRGASHTSDLLAASLGGLRKISNIYSKCVGACKSYAHMFLKDYLKSLCPQSILPKVRGS